MKIRHRIALWVAGAGFLTSLVFSLSVFWEMREQAMNILDAQLKAQTDEIAVILDTNQPAHGFPPDKTRPDSSKRNWIKVFDEKFQVIYQSDLSRLVDLPLYSNKKRSYQVSVRIPKNRIFLDQDDEDEVTFKVLATKRKIAGQSCLVHVAKPMEAIEEEIIEAYAAVGIGLFFSTIVLVFLSYAMAGRILKPLSDINRLAREIDENTLEKRIPEGDNHDELYELATHLNRMFDRLQFSFARQKQLLADASHELKSPLSMLRLFFEEACQYPGLPEPFYQELATKEQHVLRMDHLVRALLELSVLEIKASLVLEPFDLSAMVRSVLEDFEPVMEKAGILLETGIAPGIIFRGDRDRLRRAVINIIDNAITYNTERGKIRISLTQGGNRLCLSVSNTGPGIPTADLPRVFEQFYRVEKSRATAHGGAGLGLSIVKEIIRLHKGDVTIESRPGDWTRVAIVLPYQTGEAET